MNMTIRKSCAVSALAIAGFTCVVVWQQSGSKHLRKQLADAETQIATLRSDLAQLRDEYVRNQRSLAPAAPTSDTERFHELLRLRGETGVARRQLTGKDQELRTAQSLLEESKARAAKWGDTGAVLTAMEAATLRSLSASAKTKMLKDAMATLRSVAETNVTGFQLRLSQVAPEVHAMLGVLGPESGFGVVYRGPLQDLQNPGRKIVVRQLEPEEWPDGRFFRIYGFGDGDVEIHKTSDGKVDDWEKERLVPGDH